jgi:hypothetical protein
MHKQELLLMTITVAVLSAVPAIVTADKLDGFDDTMQVLEDAADLEKTAAYLKVPDTDAADEAVENEIIDPVDFDDDFEHDVEFEEELMQDEDDFEDGDDVDDDRIGAFNSTAP